MTRLSFWVNSVNSIRLQRIFQFFFPTATKYQKIFKKKIKNGRFPFQKQIPILKLELLNHQWEDQRRWRRKNPTHDPFGDKRRNHWSMRAWFRLYLPDFPKNRALLEGGALVSTMVTRQVDWIFHRRHRQGNPLTVRLLPLQCWVLHSCKFAIAGGVVCCGSWQQWWCVGDW